MILYNSGLETWNLSAGALRAARTSKSAPGGLLLSFGGRRKGNHGRGAAGKVPVFGILTREGLVHVEVDPNARQKHYWISRSKKSAAEVSYIPINTRLSIA